MDVAPGEVKELDCSRWNLQVGEGMSNLGNGGGREHREGHEQNGIGL